MIALHKTKIELLKRRSFASYNGQGKQTSEMCYANKKRKFVITGVEQIGDKNYYFVFSVSGKRIGSWMTKRQMKTFFGLENISVYESIYKGHPLTKIFK